MVEFLMSPAARRILGSLVRRGLDILGTYLVTRGLATDADVTDLAIALTPVVVSLVWSLWQKAWQERREQVALELPSGSTAADVTAELQRPAV